jgi:hypothetical protein
LFILLLYHHQFRQIFSNVQLAFNSSRSEALAPTLRNFQLISKTILILYFIPFTTFVIASIGNYFFQENLTLPVEVYIPFIDYTTPLGYGLTILIQLFYLTIGGLVFCCFEVCYICLSYFIVSLNGLFKIKLDELAELLKDENRNDPKIGRKIEEGLKEVFESHLSILK